MLNYSDKIGTRVKLPRGLPYRNMTTRDIITQEVVTEIHVDGSKL